MCQCAFLCHNLHFYGNWKWAWQFAVSSDLFKCFSAHHIEDNDSIVELFPLRIFINHLILVCVVLISPQHQAGRVKLPAAVHGSHHLMPQGLGKDTKSLMRILSKIEEPNRGSTTWRRLERGAAQGSMCSHRAKGLLIRQ